MKPKYNSNGFGLLETILLVVTLGFIGAVALVVLNNQHTDEPQPAHKVDLSKNLKIKEWNVYLGLPDTSSKVNYKLANPGDNKNIIISSEALDKFSTDHKECSSANEFNVLIRIKAGDGALGLSPEEAKVQLDKRVSEKTAKKVGQNYYYGSRPSTSPCIGSNIAEIQKLTNDVYDLYDKLPTYQNVAINP
jgi:hypothetical protein